MSRESGLWLNQNTLIGFTEKRGNAWHRDVNLIGDLDNHYAGAIPEGDILSRLFHWDAVESPLYIQTPMGMMPVDGKKAITRSDDYSVLGVHSERYRPHHYRDELIGNLSTLVTGNVQYANAGLLKGGAVAWVQVETPDNVKTSGGVEFRPSILAATSFDGSLETTFKPVITNVVCDNTMSAAMAESGPEYRRKHTRNSAFVLADAQAALDMIERTAETMLATVDALTNVEVSDKVWSDFISAHCPINLGDSKKSVTMAENKRAALTGLYRTDIRVAPWNGSAWGVIQAVNTFNEHMSIVRNAHRFERKMLNAISDTTRDADVATVATLSGVLGRQLISA